MFTIDLTRSLDRVAHDLTIIYIKENPPSTSAGAAYANIYKTTFEQIKATLQKP